MREHALVSSMLSEMTRMMGCADEERNWITDTNIRWQLPRLVLPFCCAPLKF